MVDGDYNDIALTIKSVSWSKDLHQMIFLTDNPIAKDIETNKFPFMRLL